MVPLVVQKYVCGWHSVISIVIGCQVPSLVLVSEQLLGIFFMENSLHINRLSLGMMHTPPIPLINTSIAHVYASALGIISLRLIFLPDN